MPRSKARGNRKAALPTIQLTLYPLGRTPPFSNPRNVAASREETWYDLLRSSRLGLGHSILNDGVIVCSQTYKPSKPVAGKGWKANDLHEMIGVSLKKYKKNRAMATYKVRVGKPFLPGNGQPNVVNPVLAKEEAIPGSSHGNRGPLTLEFEYGVGDQDGENLNLPSDDDYMDDDRSTIVIPRNDGSASIRTTDSVEDNELRNQGIDNIRHFKSAVQARFDQTDNANLVTIKAEMLRQKNENPRGWNSTIRRFPHLMNFARDLFL